jgi:hypothetical protein
VRAVITHLPIFLASAQPSKAGSRFACPRTPKSGVVADGMRHAPRLWTAPAKRSGDGALDSDGMGHATQKATKQNRSVPFVL